MLGCITALITPFNNGEIDYESFQKVLDFQLKQGIKNFVVNGTTAETPTLSLKEKRKALEFVLNYVPKDINIVVGASSNNTTKMIEEIKNIEDLDFEYLLISTPYYNKTTQVGLIKHIEEALKNTKKKIILYNIPSRCGMEFSIPTLEVLAQHEQIVGIKEASGDFNYAQQLFLKLGNRLDIYCGNDDLTYLYATLGAKGVISAVGNIYGIKFNIMYDYILQRDFKKANEINMQILTLSNMLFLEVNPILIKGLMSKLGLIRNELRLPLVPAEQDLIDQIYEEYKRKID